MASLSTILIKLNSQETGYLIKRSNFLIIKMSYNNYNSFIKTSSTFIYIFFILLLETLKEGD